MAALNKESSETTTKIEATLVRAVKYETVKLSRSRPSYRLVGPVVSYKASASRAEDPGFESRLRCRFFSGSSQETPVPT